nr:nuclease-related domain-containing protein [Mammaliicoccus sp. Marseille-Q6498]
MQVEFFKIMEALIGRAELDYSDLQKYDKIKKGKEGERKFLSHLNTNTEMNYIYNLEVPQSDDYQFDFLVISDDYIYQFEIKNYFGKYNFQNGKLKGQNGFLIKDPFFQIERNEELLERIIFHYNLQRKVKSYVVFVNDTFKLTGDIQDDRMILPSQLNKVTHLIKNNNPEQNAAIKNLLQKLNQPFQEKYTVYPDYEFEKVKPGLRCLHCKSIMEEKPDSKAKKHICSYCYSESYRRDLILNTLEELLIIKRKPFSMREARKWCNGIHRNTISHIINKEFKIKYINKTKVFYK